MKDGDSQTGRQIGFRKKINYFDRIQPDPVSQLSSGRTWDQPSDNLSGPVAVDIRNTSELSSGHDRLLPERKFQGMAKLGKYHAQRW